MFIVDAEHDTNGGVRCMEGALVLACKLLLLLPRHMIFASPTQCYV